MLLPLVSKPADTPLATSGVMPAETSIVLPRGPLQRTAAEGDVGRIRCEWECRGDKVEHATIDCCSAGIGVRAAQHPCVPVPLLAIDIVPDSRFWIVPVKTPYPGIAESERWGAAGGDIVDHTRAALKAMPTEGLKPLMLTRPLLFTVSDPTLPPSAELLL